MIIPFCLCPHLSNIPLPSFPIWLPPSIKITFTQIKKLEFGEVHFWQPYHASICYLTVVDVQLFEPWTELIKIPNSLVTNIIIVSIINTFT